MLSPQATQLYRSVKKQYRRNRLYRKWRLFVLCVHRDERIRDGVPLDLAQLGALAESPHIAARVELEAPVNITASLRTTKVPAENPWELLLRLYEIHREYIEHEDDLINHRSTWHLLLQGFLFAAFGVIGQWQTEKGCGFLTGERYDIVYVLAGTGFLIALAALASTFAANMSVRRLIKGWDRITRRSGVDPKIWRVFPGLGGAGKKWIAMSGAIPAVIIPIVIVFAWGFILQFTRISERSKPADSPSVSCAKATQPREKLADFLVF
jgi:hypothetical protein